MRAARVWRKYIRFPIVRMQTPMNRIGAPGIVTAKRAEISTPTKTTRCSTSRSCRKRGSQMVRHEFALSAKPASKKKRHLNPVEGECQQAPQGVKSQTILEQLWHVATAMDNGNDLQRRYSRPVDNQVGVDWEELHPFIRQILAPMPGARVCR